MALAGEIAMDESEQLSRLIAEIYDAALDRSLWLSVLEKTCGFVNGQTAGLLAQHPRQGRAQFFSNGERNRNF